MKNTIFLFRKAGGGKRPGPLFLSAAPARLVASGPRATSSGVFIFALTKF